MPKPDIREQIDLLAATAMVKIDQLMAEHKFYGKISLTFHLEAGAVVHFKTDIEENKKPEAARALLAKHLNVSGYKF